MVIPTDDGRRVTEAPVVGVLALQGDFEQHLKVLSACRYEGIEVRTPEQLENIDALIIPGGESTAMLKLMDRSEIREPLTKRIHEGLPVFGTCAGAILLAAKVSDGEEPLGVLDMEIERNAYGRQVDSFEVSLPVIGIAEPDVEAVFIRAPVIVKLPQDAEVLATWADDPVLVRAGSVLVSTFHPELSGDHRIHRWFVENMVKS